jgi:hypothetical protein
MINAWLAICPALQPSRDQQPGGCSQAPSFPSNTSPDCLQLAGGDLAALSREVLGVPDPDISRAAGGGYGPKEGEESEGGGSGGGALQRQPRRRGRLPEADYRDGAGI